MLRRPFTIFPTKLNDESRPPTDGNVVLQVDNGVATARLQLFRTEERRNCKGSNDIENTPMLFVVVVDTTFPLPHLNCTAASA